VLNNTLVGGARGFSISAYASETPSIFGWTHAPLLGATISGNTLVDNNIFGIVVFDADGITKNNTITGGRVGIGVAAATQDTTELSSGDHISGVSDSATQIFECCGFHATVTVKN
jgi:parallel beta-helix repeat protein